MHLFHRCTHHSSSLTVNISPLLFVYLARFKRGLGFVTTRFDKVCVHSRALWGCTVNLEDLLMNEVITKPPSGAADPKVHPKQSDIYPLGDGVNVSKYTSQTPNRGRNCLADWGDCVLSLKKNLVNQELLGELQLHLCKNEAAVCVQETVTQITQGQIISTTTHTKARTNKQQSSVL